CTDTLGEPSISGLQPDSSEMVLQLGVEDLRVVVRGGGADRIADPAAEASRNRHPLHRCHRDPAAVTGSAEENNITQAGRWLRRDHPPSPQQRNSAGLTKEAVDCQPANAQRSGIALAVG